MKPEAYGLSKPPARYATVQEVRLNTRQQFLAGKQSMFDGKL
jgi:hypothetical protein